MLVMRDGGIKNIEYDSYSYSGCPTCNYGSEYINEVTITTSSYILIVKSNVMYEHLFTEGDFLKIILQNTHAINTKTEEEFKSWFVDKVTEAAKAKDPYITSEKCIFHEVLPYKNEKAW